MLALKGRHLAIVMAAADKCRRKNVRPSSTVSMAGCSYMAFTAMPISITR
jgi:hypothetical protein